MEDESASEGFLLGDSVMLYHYGDLVLRYLVVGSVAYYASFSTSKQRWFSGLQFGVLAGLLTFTYLEPLFVPVGSDVAKVGLNVLTIYGALIGLSLGIMLPFILPGVTFGALMTIFVGTFVTSSSAVSFSTLFFPIAGGVLALLSGLISARFCSSVMVTLSTALEGGAIISCLILKGQMLAHIQDFIRGYTMYPKEVGDNDQVFVAIGMSAEFMMEALWVLTSTLIMIAIIHRDGNLKSIGDISNFIPFGNRGYEAIPTNEKNADKAGSGAATKAKSNNKRTITRDPASGGPAPDGYNMFDPADLPTRLAEYANMVYSACEDLGNFFGFQDSSVRNQAEHLLILLSNNRRYMSAHILPPPLQPPSPIHALHAKVFRNYVQWCRAMNVVPNFSQMNTSMNAPPAVASRVVDLVLWFCIWGEAANIRHLPECLCFLYHKTMEEYVMNEGYTQTRSLYAGHFLDWTVTPIYNVLSLNMKSKKDHVERRNYDDFNEFFWSRNCLKYHYSSQDPNEQVDLEGNAGGGIIGPLPGEFMPPLTEGLNSAPKTFLEKRSWLRGILALNRILEWHIVTFYLLAVVAFSSELVWGWVYSMTVASFVFWILNALHLTWALLEVWGSYPGIQLVGTEVCGSIFILVARFLTLVYQSLYIMWAFAPQTGIFLGIEADSTFWWWQYIWLSLLVMIPYFFEAVLQICPAVTSWIYTSQNDFVQAFLNMLYPLSRLYVGKEVKESVSHTLVYMFFWVTLMCWKLYFSYIFEVYSMVLPTLELVDDYANYPGQSFFEMFLLLAMRWLPQFLVYIIDMSIWYAVWQAFAGTSVGFSEHLGDIRSIEDIRMNFGRAPEYFCKKMLSPDAGSRRGSAASFASSTSLLNNTTKGPGYSSGGTPITANERSNLVSNIQNRLNRLLDVRIQKWVMFSAAWNEIIDHLRVEDLVSNEECDNLKFSQFHGFSQAIYLPAFQTAGVIDEVITVVERPAEDYVDPNTGEVTDETLFQPIGEIMHTAISEAWELGSFLLLQLLGPIHHEDVHAIGKLIDEWKNDGTLSTHVKVERMRSVMNHVIAVISTLHQGTKKRKPALKPRGSARKAKETAKPSVEKKDARKAFRRVVSAGSLTSLSVDTDGKSYNNRNKNMDSLGASKIVKSQMIHHERDALRDQTREKLRNMVQAMKPLLKNFEENDKSRNVLDRLTFLGSVENGFFWNDNYASDQLDSVSKNETFKAVLKKMHGLVCLHPDDVIPKSKEVTRRLTFFTNSLFMDMPDAPSIHDMFSWNILTPYYSEDVTYSKRDLEKRSDALGVSTMLYLQTLYRGDWNNFLERMGVEDDAEVWSKKCEDETRRWASIRAQTLSRTVNGMMYCEKALRLLANMERLDEDTTNDLLGEKFGYIVACQVYGNMKKNQDSKADDIEALMHRFPHLRIAYIDNVRINRAGASVFYSVLVKSDRKGGVQEIYRVRLPGNAILGEGKPENQNHAMIFTRGEFLQTIDMNQEGYFEEALKMRNVLQEFAKREGPLPTTILGLREHIFTGSVSSLANYMALQETSFVTLGQRVLAKPLRMRLHYGHPDLFDKLFFITRGGISKSSKGINLSEDIFVGYNNVIRGGACGFKEYVQVGKGRDVGMSQIYKFEAKLSQGNAEQSLSRDVYRMCHRLDFFRLFSYYYGGIGHYFSNVLTIFTVYIVVYVLALLAVYDIEKIGDRLITPMGGIQMLLGGLGLLQTIPLFATLGVERGWWESIREIFFVFVTGGPLHFMFHIQTKAQYMAQTILVGGAKYRPTGRGFVTQHTPFDEQFRFFASSHMYMGIELAAGLILLAIFTKAGQYPGRTWSLWLASVSFLWSPLWFNPLTFDWKVVVSDYSIWLRWMQNSSGGSSKSWSIWWTEDNGFYKSMAMPSKCLFLVKAVLYVLIAEGIRRSDLFRADTSLYIPVIGISKVLMFIVAFFLLSRFFNSNDRSMPYPVRRTIGILIFIALVMGVVTLFIEDKNFIRFALSAYYGLGALCMVGLLFGVKQVKFFYMIHDFVVGHIIFALLLFFAAIQFYGKIQTWLLYHNALSTDVVVGDILRYARKAQDSGTGGSDSNNEDLVSQITELRKIVQRQEQSLANAGIMHSNDENADGSSGAPAVATSAVSQILNAQSNVPQPKIRRPVPLDRSGFNRTKSLSGIDVWSGMAYGSPNDDGNILSGGDGGGNNMSGRASPSNNAASSSQDGGFSFTQPDVMPPR